MATTTATAGGAATVTSAAMAAPDGTLGDGAAGEVGALEVTWCVLLGGLAVASVLGNLLVLLTLHRAWSDVGAKPGNLLALALAAADLLNTLVNLPIAVAGVARGEWLGSAPVRKVHYFFLVKSSRFLIIKDDYYFLFFP